MVCPATTRNDRRLAQLLNQRARVQDAIDERREELHGPRAAAIERLDELVAQLGGAVAALEEDGE